MPDVRQRAAVLAALNTVSNAQHLQLKSKGAADNKFWGTTEAVDKALISAYKTEVKDHYFWQQNAMCCYCSSEIQPNKRGYDAEHIIDKDEHPHLMFELDNIAASCIVCNGHKSNKNVLVAAGKPGAVPKASADYLLVHPHLDEWGDYLTYDVYDRVVAIPENAKGQKTIEICGIKAINATRLARRFSANQRSQAYKLLVKFYDYKTKRKQQEILTALEGLAQHSLESAALIDDLRALLDV
ncbi:HNH endonuclease family protein [Roseateles koreensis]|uniref:TIGR02646 family protein n=1 Tax=Roseateles koreensis TaxID=2987526 RepID=A0ABT5KTP1_9BURK|nr:hypothetical protein [Roseateles koreensis]MDC8786303.1 hypothetical protein [Roseateles koreensis]